MHCPKVMKQSRTAVTQLAAGMKSLGGGVRRSSMKGQKPSLTERRVSQGAVDSADKGAAALSEGSKTLLMTVWAGSMLHSAAGKTSRH